MYELINGTPMPVREYNGQRVVTFRDIDSVHQRPEGTAKRNFNSNKKYFIEGVDFFVRNSYEAKTEFGIIAPNGLTLVTLSGYLMIAKSFTDDLSWDVQRMLVTYFMAREQADNYSDLLQRQNELESRLNQLESKLSESSFRLPKKSSLQSRQENAVYIMEKLYNSGETVFTKHILFRMCQKLKAKELTEALKFLDEMQVISYQKIQNGKRGKPKEIIVILKTDT
ncbi:MAG: ORF6N domain-containing protein [Ruminococcus sp.]|nr:ORF6N domain-containing protein [Ruminococcus sp.]